MAKASPAGCCSPISDRLPVTHSHTAAVRRYHVLFDLLELHETAPLPDLEMLVFSGEFAVVTKRGDDGTLPPIFSRYSSRSAYDLTLPGGPYLLGRCVPLCSACLLLLLLLSNGCQPLCGPIAKACCCCCCC